MLFFLMFLFLLLCICMFYQLFFEVSFFLFFYCFLSNRTIYFSVLSRRCEHSSGEGRAICVEDSQEAHRRHCGRKLLRSTCLAPACFISLQIYTNISSEFLFPFFFFSFFGGGWVGGWVQYFTVFLALSIFFLFCFLYLSKKKSMR